MILFSPGERRPTHKELSAKLWEARNLTQGGRWLPARVEKLDANFRELEEEFDVETTLPEDKVGIVLAVLAEIRPDDYVGDRPPQRSYEQATRTQELFEFQWTSGHFSDAVMYFKFSICGTGEYKKLYIYSLHRNREESQE